MSRLLCGLLWLSALGLAAEPKVVVFIPGSRSHGFGTHEHRAECLLLAKALNEGVSGLRAVVATKKQAAGLLPKAAAVVIDCDGGAVAFLGPLADEVDKLARRGGGVACIHYALVAPKGPQGKRMLEWIGGYYEPHWSVNPMWEANFKSLPKHPVTRGVRPFRIRDEWYYHMRFLEGMKGVTPILTAVPPDATRKRPFGAHSGNPAVRARMGMPEHVAWAYQRPGGGRGFGFTGGHFHWNWAHDDFRRLVLNAVVWIAGLEVPEGGVDSKTPTVDDLLANLDEPRPKNWSPDPLARLLREWKSGR